MKTAEFTDSAGSPRRSRSKLEKILLPAVILLAAILIVSAAIVVPLLRPVQISVRYFIPGSELSDSGNAGSLFVLRDGPEIDGYRFLGWRDAQGNMETRSSFPVYENTSYSAVYAMRFEEDLHIPYLELEDGFIFRPLDSLTRREAAVMFYKFLNVKLVGKGEFSDVSADDPCHAAAATLKDLGVISGSRFHPGEAISRGELFEMLAAFYPRAVREYGFPDLKKSDSYYDAFCTAAENGWIEAESEACCNTEISRAETACLINRILGRGRGMELTPSMTGTLADVSFDSAYYADIAESCIPHEYRCDGSVEIWMASEARPLVEPGFYFTGVDLRCADESGSAVVDREVDGLYFGSTGIESSGDPELDTLVHGVLADVIDPEAMSSEEMLKILYSYVVQNYSYLRRNYYDMGVTDWACDEAYTMLSTHKGNCYNFAAAFYTLARAIGYDAVIYSGTIALENSPHAWVEIEFDGEPYVFDPEIEYSSLQRGHVYSNMYKMSYTFCNRWSYQRTPR